MQFLIRRTEVIAGFDEVLTHFGQVRNRLIDLINRIGEALVGQAHVARETVLERHQFLFEIRHIHLLRLHQRQFALRVQALLTRLAEERDKRNEELRTNDVHLLKAMTHVHDTAVIEFAIRLEHRHQHRIFAAFLTPVSIQFGEEIFVLMLGSRLVVLVLHLKHDRDILHAVFALVAEDEIAFCTLYHLVVFLEISVRHEGAEQLVKERGAMDLQRLTHHLRAHALLEVFVIRHLLLRSL